MWLSSLKKCFQKGSKTRRDTPGTIFRSFRPQNVHFDNEQHRVKLWEAHQRLTFSWNGKWSGSKSKRSQCFAPLISLHPKVLFSDGQPFSVIWLISFLLCAFFLCLALFPPSWEPSLHNDSVDSLSSNEDRHSPQKEQLFHARASPGRASVDLSRSSPSRDLSMCIAVILVGIFLHRLQTSQTSLCLCIKILWHIKKEPCREQRRQGEGAWVT